MDYRDFLKCNGGAPPPVFSLYTGFTFRMWRKYGSLIHVSLTPSTHLESSSTMRKSFVRPGCPLSWQMAATIKAKISSCVSASSSPNFSPACTVCVTSAA